MIERKRGDCLIIMNITTIEQACDPSNWRWKRWDFRSDGSVFWQYQKTSLNGELWVTWESAIKIKNGIKRRHQSNKPKVNEKQKIWRLKNLDKIKKQQSSSSQKKRRNAHRRKKIKTNPIFAMAIRVRKRTQHSIKRFKNQRKCKTQKMLGCDWSHLKIHLESKFTDGMSWENRSMWHIDHIIPLASAKSIEEVVKLCHYTNLQPLWAADNLSKGSKIVV